jgi:hypothetical protein
VAQVLTIGWMVVELAIALAAGASAQSVALTAFGLDSGIEIFTAAVVLHPLMERTELEERGELTSGEQRASRLVGLGLYALVVYIVVAAAATFVLRLRPEPSPVGIGLAIAAIGVMSVLCGGGCGWPASSAARHSEATPPARSSVST